MASSPVWVRFDPGRMEPVCLEESTSIESSFYDLCVHVGMCVCEEGGGGNQISVIYYASYAHTTAKKEEESYPSSHLVQFVPVFFRRGWDGTRYEPGVDGMELGTSQAWVRWNPV